LPREQEGEKEIIGRFLEVYAEKEASQPPSYQPPSYQQVIFEEEKKKPEIFLRSATAHKDFGPKKSASSMAFHPLARRGSMESQAFTDSDAASNVSFAA
jgi:hypothetical protein